MTASYTQVFYFSEHQPAVEDLDRAIAAIEADWHDRKPFVHARAHIAGDRRVQNLRLALALLVEPVPRSFGG